MKNILITGGCGFLGQHLINELLKNKNTKIKVLDLKDNEHSVYDHKDEVEYVLGKDVVDFNAIKNYFQNIEVVFHLAGFISFWKGHEKQLFAVNELGTRNVLQACLDNNVKQVIYVSSVAALGFNNKKDRKKLFDVNVSGTRKVMKAALDLKTKKVVHCSSTAALGIGDSKGDLLTEESEFKPRFKRIGYMYSKKLAEDEVLKACQEGLNACLVNPSSIMGAGDEKMNSGALFRNIKNNRLKAATPGGNSIVAVSDVVEGLILAMEKGRGGQRYILNSQNIGYFDLFNVIAKVVDSKRIKRKIPKIAYYPLIFVARLLEKVNKNAKLTPEVLFFSFKYRYFDSSKAKKELGWIPEQDLEATVREAADYYEKRGLI